MNAVTLEVVIPENRELRLRLPSNVAPGPATITISASDDGDAGARVLGLLEFLDRPARGNRTKEDIDRQIREERSGWRDR
jgi:hypothetical protein